MIDAKMLGVILTLAWPTMLEQFMQTSVQYIDTAMVGSLGTRATAAVGATSMVNWLIGSTVSAIGVGFLALISQAIGAGNRERAKKASAQAVMVTAVLKMVAVSEPFYGVPIVVEGMMQGTGQTVIPLKYNLATMWGVRIAGTFICNRLLGVGLRAAWGCMIGHNLALFFLFGNRYRSGKWNILREDQPRESREMSGTKEKSSRKTGKNGGRYSREEAEDVSFDHYR